MLHRNLATAQPNLHPDLEFLAQLSICFDSLDCFAVLYRPISTQITPSHPDPLNAITLVKPLDPETIKNEIAHHASKHPFNLQFPNTISTLDTTDTDIQTGLTNLTRCIDTIGGGVKVRNRDINRTELGHAILSALFQLPKIYRNNANDQSPIEECVWLAKQFHDSWSNHAGKPSVTIPSNQIGKVLSLTFCRLVAVPGVFSQILRFPALIDKLVNGDHTIKSTDFIEVGATILTGQEIKELPTASKQFIIDHLTRIIPQHTPDSARSMGWTISTIWAYIRLIASPDISPSRDLFCKRLETLIENMVNRPRLQYWQVPFMLAFSGSTLGISMSAESLTTLSNKAVTELRKSKNSAGITIWQHTVVNILKNDPRHGAGTHLNLFSALFLPDDFTCQSNHHYFCTLFKLMANRSNFTFLATKLKEMPNKLIMVNFKQIEAPGIHPLSPSTLAEGICLRLILSFFLDIPEHEIQANVNAVLENPNASAIHAPFITAIGQLSGYLNGMINQPYSAVKSKIFDQINTHIDRNNPDIDVLFTPGYDDETLMTPTFFIETLVKPLGHIEIRSTEPARLGEPGTNRTTSFPVRFECRTDSALNQFVKDLAVDLNLPVTTICISPDEPTDAGSSPITPPPPQPTARPLTEKKAKVKTRKAAAGPLPAPAPSLATPSMGTRSQVSEILEAGFADCIRRGIKYRAIIDALKQYLDEAGPTYAFRIEEAPGGRHRHLRIRWRDGDRDHQVKVAVGHLHHSSIHFSVLKAIANEFVQAVNEVSARQLG